MQVLKGEDNGAKITLYTVKKIVSCDSDRVDLLINNEIEAPINTRM